MAADFELLSQQLDFMRSWTTALPRRIAEATASIRPKIEFGERHGSWSLRLSWMDGQLSKAAELALTDATDATVDLKVSDIPTETVVVSVRASATTNASYVCENIYERRRGVRGISRTQLERWFLSAIERAGDYNIASLVSSYSTGVPTTSRESS